MLGHHGRMTLQLGFLLYPGLTQLDLTGPYEVLSRMPGATVHLVWKEPGVVTSDSGLGLVATRGFADCPKLDLVFIPGGGGQIALMQDDAVLDWVAARGAEARWVTSVCTGALVLGAAGLLKGYRAATHWGFQPLLSLFGAQPVDERVVVDRNRITAGGVTAGIDFGLRVVAEVAGDHVAKTIQLYLEYDPAPPFTCGHPRTAPADLVAQVRATFAERYAIREDQLKKIVARIS
jgi:cyclohexyl-isocyanide hydratase